MKKTFKQFLAAILAMIMTFGMMLSPLGEVFHWTRKAQASGKSGAWNSGSYDVTIPSNQVTDTMKNYNVGASFRGWAKVNSVSTTTAGTDAVIELTTGSNFIKSYQTSYNTACMDKGWEAPKVGWYGSDKVKWYAKADGTGIYNYGYTATLASKTKQSDDSTLYIWNVVIGFEYGTYKPGGWTLQRMAFRVKYSVPSQKAKMLVSKQWYNVNGSPYESITVTGSTRNGISNLMNHSVFKKAYTGKFHYELTTTNNTPLTKASQDAGLWLARWTATGSDQKTVLEWYNGGDNAQLGSSGNLVTNIKPGTYYVHEVYVSGNGFATNTGPEKITLTAGETKYFVSPGSASINTNQPIVGELSIYKTYDGNKITVPGAKFELWYNPTKSPSSDLSMTNTLTTTSVSKITGASADTIKLGTATTNNKGDGVFSISSAYNISGWNYTDDAGTTFCGPAGYYTIVETQAPTGYTIQDSSRYKNYSFTSGQVHYTNTNVVYESKSTAVFAEGKYYNFRADKNYQNLDGHDATSLFSDNDLYRKTRASYELRWGSSTGAVIATGSTNSNGAIIWSLGANAASTPITLSTTTYTNDTIDHIPSGTNLYFAEVKSPNGFEVASGGQTITIDGNKYITAGTALDESPIEVELSIRKYIEGQSDSEAAASLASGEFDGAVFDVYWTAYSAYNLTHGVNITNTSDSERTVSISNSTNTDSTQSGYGKKYSDIIYKFGTFTIESGKIKAVANTVSINSSSYKPSVNNSGSYGKFVRMPIGKYMIVETKAPTSGIKLSTQNYYLQEFLSNEVTKQSYKTNTKTRDTASYVQWQVLNDISLEAKISEGPKSNNVSIILTKTAADEELAAGSVEGAEYAVFYSKNSFSAGSVSIGDPSQQNDCSWLRSATPSAGISRVGTFTVNADGVGIVTANTWVGDNNVKNATLNIETFFGEEGFYYIVEVKAPANYVFDDDISDTVHHLTADGTADLSLTSVEESCNDPIILNIEKKTDGSVTEMDAAVLKSFNGTEFTLNFYKGYSDWDGTLKSGVKNGSIVPDKTLVYKVIDGNVDFKDPTYLVSGEPYTNEFGDIAFPVGVYTISETKASEGFSVSNNTWEGNDGNTYTGQDENTGLVFRVIQHPEYPDRGLTYILGSNGWSADPVNSVGTEFVVEKGNTPDSATIKLTKNKVLPDDTSVKLPGVDFKLYYYNNAYKALKGTEWDKFVEYLATEDHDNYQPYLEQADQVISFTTDVNGEYNSGKLLTGWYVLIEQPCEANKGLVLVTPKAFELRKDEVYVTTESNHTPSMSTQEWDGELSTEDYKTHMSNPDEDVKIVDKVHYDRLPKSSVYTVKAVIMDITSGIPVVLKDTTSKIVQAAEQFTTGSDHLNSDDVLVNFDSFSVKELGLEGHKFVVYEFLFEGDQTSVLLTESDIDKLTGKTSGTVEKASYDNDGKVIGHYDATDDNQIGYFPELHTIENDSLTLNHVSPVWEEDGKEYIKVSDTLTYKNLDVSLTYTVKVIVKDVKDDSTVAEKEVPLIPSAADGELKIDDIVFEAGDIDSFYICEELYVGPVTDGKKAGEHTEKIEAQTGYVASIGTTASSSSANGQKDSGINLAWASKNVTLTDVVAAHNLSGLAVTITCEYRYVTGENKEQVVTDASGKTLTKTITHTFGSNADENISIEITGLNLTNLKDQTIVAYETISYENSRGEEVVVAKEHKDDSLEQSIKFVGTPVRFAKQDTFGNPVSGAKFQISDSDNNVVETWTSDGTAKEYVLADGDYTLAEVEAPEDYGVCEPVKFTVEFGKLYVNGQAVDEAVIVCEDTPLTSLPTAGGMGTAPFALSGITIMLGLMFYNIIKRKKA